MSDSEQSEFLFMADAHIKTRTWTNNMQLAGDAYKALDRLQHSDSLSGVNMLVIGGDWFDSNRPSSIDLARTREFMLRFNIIYFIPGNHDNVSPSFLEVFDQLVSAHDLCTIHKLSEDIISMYGVDHCYIAGIPWTHSAEDLKTKIKTVVDNFKTSYSSDDILYLVLHTSFKHLLAFDGAYKLTKEFIAEVCGDSNIRVLVGDIHTRNTTVYNEDTGAYIHSPGSLYPLSFDKAEEQNMVSKINFQTGAITDIPVDVRTYVTWNYTNRTDLNTLVAGVVQDNPEGFMKPFIRTVVTDADVQITDGEYPDVVIQVVSSQIETDTVRHEARHETYTISQAIEEELADDDPDINDLAQALYASDDPLAEIESWLNLWNVERVV
jgi:DNA repair exonuclease SbcCD nuclease subunit